MKKIKDDLLEIYTKNRSVLVLMLQVFALSLAIFIFSLTKIDATSSVVKVGYGDIGGYRDGVWLNMLAFPLLALTFGVLHNLLAIKIFEKRGAGMAKFFLIITMLLLLGVLVVLIRLSSEG